ncbi:hypothetical protein EGM88_07465 [Aureibaculum marinum]|uniref:Lipocalin-like domain-containing protein n=1 Tax=Aureibaculum marinum TaxID=2487930 RepID=A0A3N4PEN4_9FLAO|nr:hypothetical protein [Aureibaculum marinum]RPD97993.1 hypothetical protein EGM88_07465 [Aureibaculum marinum]
MKIRILTLIIIWISIIFSCSKDRNDIETDNRFDILVENSPWTYHDYKLIAVIDRTGFTITDEEIEELAAESAKGVTLTFKADGTGMAISGTTKESNTWLWTLKNNEIELIWDQPKGTVETFKNVEISNTQLKFEENAWRIDKDGNKLKWYGAYTFK